MTKEELQGITWFSNQVYLEVFVVLNHDKKVNLTLPMHSDNKAMEVAEHVAELFGETKYSISFFVESAKINLNDKLADLNLGYYKIKENQKYKMLCLKGGVDAPKIFNRFKHVDAPSRLLSYIAGEEAYDAICFIPHKNIKFAGFSVYQVLGADGQPQDFKCFYKIKIGAEQWPEKDQEFTVAQVENKMVDIIFPKEALVQAR